MSAEPKPSTLNPGVRLLARRSINALITNVKSPNVRNVIGSVKSNRMGFISAFTSPITATATSADQKS